MSKGELAEPIEFKSVATQRHVALAALGGDRAQLNRTYPELAATYGGYYDSRADPCNDFRYDAMQSRLVGEGYIKPNYYSNLVLRNSLNEYYDSLKLPAGLFETLGLDPETSHFADVIEKMYERDAAGNYLAPPHAFSEALTFINDAHAETQAKFEAEALPILLQATRERINLAVAQKRLPECLAARFEERVGQLDFVVDDGFNTLLYGFDAHYLAYLDRLTIGQFQSTGYLINALEHEIGHVLEGLANDQKGLMRAFPRSPQLGMALTESAAVLFEEVLENGADPHSLASVHNVLTNPELSYPVYRRVLHALCTYGQAKVDVNLFLDSNYAEGRDSTLADIALHSRLEDVFPDHPNLYRELEKILDTASPTGELTLEGSNMLDKYLADLRAHYNSKRSIGQKAVRALQATKNTAIEKIVLPLGSKAIALGRRVLATLHNGPAPKKSNA